MTGNQLSLFLLAFTQHIPETTNVGCVYQVEYAGLETERRGVVQVRCTEYLAVPELPMSRSNDKTTVANLGQKTGIRITPCTGFMYART